MKTLNQKTAGLFLMLLGLSISVTQCSDGGALDESVEFEDANLKSSTGEEQLSDAEAAGILFMREEEKLARDVYIYLYEAYPLRPFLNISKSEQAHMDAIKYLIDTYELEDPIGENPEGVFQNEELQELYNELIEIGSESREEALKVGALIEEIDIIDLRTELEEIAKNEDVIRVFENLCQASERHLKAFVGVLSLYDVEYTPVKLEQEEFDSILSE